MTRTEQLREAVAQALREHYLSDCPGMPSWKDCEIKDHWRAKADGALKACKDAGLVFALKEITGTRKWSEIEEIELT